MPVFGEFEGEVIDGVRELLKLDPVEDALLVVIVHGCDPAGRVVVVDLVEDVDELGDVVF